MGNDDNHSDDMAMPPGTSRNDAPQLVFVDSVHKQ
ncbi:hypothetical protein PTE31013_03652 [Pandoraea terrigena]|uniref:Uncharacterized protein n=1 Tax=Pandoraea terrigena TaxID=2508292 RepID=A0A5E4X342_9BURK|nr:hypothetical protein PTE31013_03652 [Pandoraea terrigena]